MYGLWFMKLYVLYVTLPASRSPASPATALRHRALSARTPFAVVASSVLVLMLSRPRSPRAEAL